MSWWSFIKAVYRGEHKLAGTTWTMLILTVIYTISPLDFIPELIFPVIGYVDDLGLWGVLAALAAREKSRYDAALAKEPIVVQAERIS
jgi:Uncharacterized conserved protein